MNQERDIEFLYEIGQLRHIKRMWRRFFQSDIASISDHIFRVIWIALALAKHEEKVDEEKLMKMALVHDITESRTGDVDYIARQYTTRDEDLALKDMVAGTVFEQEMVALWDEYEKRECLEAKIVKDADTLDVSLELKEQISQTVASKMAESRETHVKPRLLTQTAKQYWEIIENSSEHDWHLKGRNRFNAGDWKNS